MPVDSVERFDLVAPNLKPGTGVSDSPRRPMFNSSVEAAADWGGLKSSTQMLTFLAWRSYAEDAAATDSIWACRRALVMPMGAIAFLCAGRSNRPRSAIPTCDRRPEKP